VFDLLRHQQDVGVLARQGFGEAGRLIVDVRQPVDGGADLALQ
jgi:hypothetical protein